ncbi:MAG TPA: SDR family oxidoreductase [Sporichthyaceae bacterium]|jgi:NAD(P)-dependent dehydrogenase (short-subunit alcohol dehydrogenase family)|nr:SDR family oxidoreductase [Sporichthyaceae bacterium]
MADEGPGTRVAVVTGGGSGIGLATCVALAEEGFTLAVMDVDGDAAKVAAGPDGLGLRVDITEPDEVTAAFEEVVRSFKRIDILVNNAGITGSAAATTCHETPVEEWDRVMAVNVRGLYLCSRAALPTMIEQGSGHVITLASVAGQVVFPARAAYVASKGAALMFAKSLAVDYARSGIRSNAVCPGMVYTPMTAWRLDQPELRDLVESKIPLGRVALPEEIAEMIAVLASGRLAYLTGAALNIDGGWTAL